MRGYFVPKRKHMHIATSTTTGSGTSESHKSKIYGGARHTQLPVYQPQVVDLPSENTRRRKPSNTSSIHASVGVWILTLVQFLGGILGPARPPIHYHLPQPRKTYSSSKEP